MKVSVIIATYNRSESLRSAIDSVLSNRYSDFFLTIVDSSENDETRKLVNVFLSHDKRKRYPEQDQ